MRGTMERWFDDTTMMMMVWKCMDIYGAPLLLNTHFVCLCIIGVVCVYIVVVLFIIYNYVFSFYFW